MDFYYISGFYDIPLYGLCRFRGSICYFKIEDEWVDDVIYHVYFLNEVEKLRCLWHKFLFEIFVGTHWTNRYREDHVRKKRSAWKMDVYYKWVQKLLK